MTRFANFSIRGWQFTLRPQLTRLAIVVVSLWCCDCSTSARGADDSGNAALQYWLAFALCPPESDDVSAATSDDARLGFAVPVSEKLAEKFHGNGATALAYLHRGTSLSTCEWGIDLRKDGPLVPAPQGQKAHEIARIALLRARWRFEHNDWNGGIDDVVDTMVLARHIGRDKISRSIHFGCMLEGMAIGTAAVYLPQMPEKYRDRLDRATDQLAPFTTMREAALYQEKAIDWAVENFKQAEKEGRLQILMSSTFGKQEAERAMKVAHDADGLIRLAEAGRPIFRQLAEAMSLKPDQYDRVFKEQFAPRLDANPVAAVLGIWYEVARDEESTAHCRLLFLKTAIDFLRRGKIAIREHRDPYGDGPFELTPFDGGFELASKLVYGKRRIRQAFGQKIND